MPFVLFLIFGLWFLLICTKGRGEQISRANTYHENFPSCKHQEEFLLFWEYYLQYKQDTTRQDPIGDAWEAAREDIWKSGYLPEPFKKIGMSGWQQHPFTRRTRKSLLTEVQPKEYPSYYKDAFFNLAKYRAADCASRGIVDSQCMCYVGKDITWDYSQVQQYYAMMNKRWANIMTPLNIHQFQEIYRLPLASALEYLIICARAQNRRLRKNPSCPFHDDLIYGGAQLEVLKYGYRPISLKPLGAKDFSEAQMKYVPSWPPDESRLMDALAEDATNWSQRPNWMRKNPSTFDEYRRLVLQLYEDQIGTPEIPITVRRQFSIEGADGEYMALIEDRFGGAAPQVYNARYGGWPFQNIDRGMCPPYDSCQECMFQNQHRC